MASGRRRRDVQRALLVSTRDIRPSSNALYRALNKLLVRNGLDEYVEALCASFYADKLGRPGLPPGV